MIVISFSCAHLLMLGYSQQSELTLLGLRKDYFERKVAEAKENKERQRTEIVGMKRELGLRPTYIDEDGHCVMEL